ncbi:MAG: cell division protein FtsK [Proteobacteria bacterium]|nr:DNA translocase FtsK [Pseudomonadota bacterium]NOG59438.1 cell division protein FtsK [Pseudomonadota bacterium]
MSQASRKQKESKPITGHVITNLREVLVFASLMVAIYLFIALITYHPDDPGWSHSVTVTEVHNSAGTIGAWIADIMLYVFGYFGYLIPLMFLASGWRWFQLRRKKEPFNQVIFTVRGVGILLGLIGGCGIAWMHFYAGSALPHEVRGAGGSGAGGILGDAVGSLLLDATGDIGSTLLMLSMLLIGLTLYTGLSWLWLMDTIGEFTLNSITNIRNRTSSLKDEAEGRKAKKDREHLLKQEQEIVEQRIPPKIQEAVPEVKPSVRAIKEKQENLFEPDIETALPALSLLDDPVPAKYQYSKEALEAISRQVEIKLKDFGVSVEVVAVHPGPVITRFELDPAPGVKGSRIINLSKDLARSLSVISVRVVDVIPGKPYIGLEIPNENRELVSLIEIINTAEYEMIKSPMAIALGKDISGHPIVADLGKMPHLLVAGTTGSGKSVALNAMILSLLYKSTATDVRMIMIDPKMLELSVYEGIPNLLAPVVTDMKEAANALRWCVAEMEKRYKLMSALGVRNITGYNKKVMDAKAKGNPIVDPFYVPFGEDDEPRYLNKLPFIVVIIDELADMMMTVGKKVEELIARLAQKARAAGVHLVLATQRPSVDVITGLIKANVPSRIAFQVSSKIDSRTILDQMGAEQLLGHGDMLYLPGGQSIPERVHGAFVSDNEVHKVVADLKSRGEPEYLDEILSGPAEGGADAIPGIDAPQDDMDPLYDEAVQIVTETRKASISYIQRRLRVGYNRAARIVEEMERSGLVGPLESNGSREVLAGPPPPMD